jgi:D-alanine-D-alanine ligase
MSNLLLRVGVLRGGPSSEHHVSLNSGSAIIRAINDNLGHKYQAHDVYIDCNGSWYIDGMPVTLSSIHSKIDVALNALHGSYGEDGKVQALLEWHGIPFSGTGSVGSAIGMNKIMAKKIFSNHGIKTPFGINIESRIIKENPDEVVNKLFFSFILPAIVKPASSGSSVGVTVVKDYGQMAKALMDAADHGEEVMIEEYIKGAEASCGVIENFRSCSLYALPPIEIRPKTGFFDYKAKYENEGEEIVPATFSNEIKKELEALAKKIHEVLGLRHYSRSDFIIHPKRGILALEVNTLPGLTEQSLFPKALRAVGADLHHFVEHLIELVRGR